MATTTTIITITPVTKHNKTTITITNQQTAIIKAIVINRTNSNVNNKKHKNLHGGSAVYSTNSICIILSATC